MMNGKILKEVIDKNSIVVDATCGNGNDTLFLAQSAAKKVYAFDIQQQAIDSTLKLLQTNNCLEKCEVILDSHSNFDNYISEPIKAVVFNLGYLPNADHTITTLADTTLLAIDKFLTNLEINGRIVIVVYWGHEIMTEALKAVLDFCFTQAGFQNVRARYASLNPASGRVMEKAGMSYLKTISNGVERKGYLADLIYYQISRED